MAFGARSSLSFFLSLCFYCLLALTARADEDLDAVFAPGELRNIFQPPPPAAAGTSAPFVLKRGSVDVGIFGVDVSHHNTDCAGATCTCSLDWTSMFQHKVRFAYLKSTTGIGTVTKLDRSFPGHWSELGSFHDAGKIYRGAYHWLTSRPEDTGVNQAKYFLSVVNSSDKQLPPAVDFEEDPVSRSEDYFNSHRDICKEVVSQKSSEAYVICDGWREVPRDQIITKLRQWLETVAAASHRRPMIYTRSRYWNDLLGADGQSLAASYPIWIAQYPAPPSDWYIEHERLPWRMPRLPAGATYPVQQPGAPYSSKNIWQFTERGLFENSPLSCNGMHTPSKFDLDWFPATEDDFAREFGN
jgi:GH25 family lysozyme M1 (1,4-beta-N-acetylmuramidase)